MTYYHDLITEKSWKLLQELQKKYRFILIGGWAVYIYTHALKSRDIDFIVDYEELEKLRADYELIKNDRLKKYEIHAGEFDIDIYVPFYSELGIPVEEIQKKTRTFDGFLVPEPEVLLILKQTALKNRAGSAKGEKDALDIFSILKAGIDFKNYQALLRQFQLLAYADLLKELLQKTTAVPELNLNAHQWARLKAKWGKELLDKRP